jgi:hypothetical protein
VSAARHWALVSGATGLVGGRLVPRLVAEGFGVRALSRDPARLRTRLAAFGDAAQAAGWDGTTPPPAALAGTDSVVHLAGEPVFGGAPSAARRARIRSSRIESTEALVAAIGRQPESERPRTLVCASAVGYYGDRGEERLDETASAGRGFLAQVCEDWERAALAATPLGVRVVVLRIGIVLAREGGALPRMAAPFRLGAGIRLGDGRQWFPWIHVDDLVGLVVAALGDARWSGPVNAVAPGGVRNLELTQAIAARLGRPLLLDRAIGARALYASLMPRALRLVLGEMADELLGSRRVLPARAESLGFRFAHPRLESALAAEL